MKNFLLFLLGAFSLLPLGNSAYAAVPNYTYPANVTVYVGVAFTITPTAGGGAPTTVTTTPGLPAGWLISNTTGVITGTPTAAQIGSNTYTITLTRAGGGGGTQNPKPSITITVINPAAPIIAYPAPAPTYVFIQGTAITTSTTTPTNSGGALPATGAYAIAPTGLPTGVTFNANTGVISGTPTVTWPTTSYIVTATNAGGIGTATFTITVNPKAPAITYSTPNVYTVGSAVTLTPGNTGGAATFALTSGVLPAYFTFNTATGAITGTPTGILSLTTFTVTATNVTGSSSSTFTITVNQPAPVISYTSPTVYESGAAVSLSPTNSEPGLTISYTVTTGSLSTGTTGLSLDPVTGIISGTVPTITTPIITTVTITASTGTSTGTFDVSITENPLPPVISYTGTPYALTVGAAAPLITPSNTGGQVSITGTYGPPKVILKTANGLSGAYGMAVDASGNIFVTNRIAGTIVEYSTSGTISSFTTGAGTGPIGIVFDASGNAYVLNQTTKTIVEYAGGLGGAATTIVSTGLSNPTGIAIDASGNLYVANSGNNTITKYTTAGGTPTLTITAPGFTLLGFRFGYSISGGIAVDASGNIYVGDNNSFGQSGYVDEYNPTGTTVLNHYQKGNTISGISIDSAGNIYLTDTNSNTVAVYTANFGSTIDAETGFNTPEGVVSDSQGNFYVADFSTNTVTEYSPVKGYYLTGTLPPGLVFNSTTGLISGRPQKTGTYNVTVTAYNVSGKSSTPVNFVCAANPPVIAYTPSTNVYEVGVGITPLAPAVSGGPIMASGYTSPGTLLTGVTTPLSAPWGVAKDAGGNIWVVNNGNGSVDEYGPAGTFIKTYNIGTAAVGSLTGIALDASGNFYLTNTIGRVYKYSVASGTGALLTNTIRVAGGDVYGIAADASGNLYMNDVNNGSIWKYTASTATTAQLVIQPTGGIATPAGISVDVYGNIYIVDVADNSLIEYNSAGTYVTTLVTGLSNPYGVYIDGNGDYFIGDPGNRTVKEFNVSGVLSATLALGGTASPRGLVTDATSDLYVSDFVNNTVTMYTPTYYTLSGGALPAGLAFNTTTGTFSGTPTAVFPTTTFTITVRGSDSGTGTPTSTTTVTLTCASAPAFTYVTPQTYTVGTAIATLSPTVTAGGPVTSYSVSPALPGGLSFDTTTGDITGTPTAAAAAANYVVTATNGYGFTGTFTINITCVNPPPPIITYTTPDVYTVGTIIAPLSPNNTGGAPVSYSVGPALPAGLSIDPVTGIISGTPAATTANLNYVVTATNAGGSGSSTIAIAVNDAAPILTYATPDVYAVGSVIAPLVPVNTGGAPASYAISAPLPPGLNFNTSTGVISGNPTAVSVATDYIIIATNAAGVGAFTVNIACVAGGPVIAYTTPDVFPVGIAIAPLGPANTGTTPTSYSISAALPAGLNFDTTTGIISGTPAAIAAATVYTITASDGTNTGNTMVTISCGNYDDWIGVTSTDWNDPTNWSSGAVPTANDIAGIGVNQTFKLFPTLGPATPITNSVGAVVIGSSTNVLVANTVTQAGGFIVNAGSTLNVSGGITYQSDANSGLGYTATISGAGSVTAASINVIANTSLAVPATYTQTMESSVNSMSLTSDIALTSLADGTGNALNSTFTITGGTVSVAGTIQTSNAASSTSTLNVSPGLTATLQLSNITALSGLSAAGINFINVDNFGATVEYSGASQTWYTDAAITGLPTGISYNNIKFSGTGIKTPNGDNSSNLFTDGDFTNALTVNDAADYIDLSLPSVFFDGSVQNIYAGNGTGTTFYNLNFVGSGTVTIQSGGAYVASAGLLAMGGGSAILTVAGGSLTLNSDANGSATVAPIPPGCSITGTVNVQRFITGGANHRGYRLLSSPVFVSAVAPNNVLSLNYLINSCYIKGTTGTAGGFDASGNPNIYLFRENIATSNTTFTSGNYRGINTLGFGITNVNYLIDGDPGTFNIPAANGYLFFFRGDRTVASLAAETSTTYVPTNTVLTASGTLNQGAVTVSDWYTPASSNLGFTTTPGSTVQGFNLVGNPYASSIDWDQYNTASTTTGIYGASLSGGAQAFIYVTDPVSQNFNVYQAGNLGVGTIASTNSNILPSGQGFFVQALSAASLLTFNESAKSNTQANAANGNLFLGKPPVAIVPQYLKLKLSKDSANVDGILISFNRDAKQQYVPGEDAIYKPGNGVVSISSMSSDNVKLAINTLPLPKLKPIVIPLNVNAQADGAYQVSLAAVKSVPALYDFWLKDAYAKDSVDIRHNPVYAFTLTHSDTTTYGANRFSLIIRQRQGLWVRLLKFIANKVDDGDQVVWTTENEENYTNFTVQRSTDGGSTYNVLGDTPSSGLGTYSLLDKTPALGANMYRLQMTDLNGTISYSNVVTLMYANTGNHVAINGFMLYPNPTAGQVHVAITLPNNETGAGTTGAAYNIEIVNNLGAVIKSAKSNQPTWQADVSDLMPGTYFIRVINAGTNNVVGKSAFVKL